MRNRAKCKLCESIIESFANIDLVSCKCGEISIAGGENKYECFANDFSNFLRVDDEGNEIIVMFKEKEAERPREKTSKQDLLAWLDEMIKRYDDLPEHAMYAPITHSDFISLLLLMSAFLKVE